MQQDHETETGIFSTFTRRQSKLLCSLAEGKGISETCREMKLHRSVYYKWQESPEFRAACKKLRQLSFQHVSDELSQAAHASFEVLKNLLGSPDDCLKYKAAVSILDVLLKVRSLDIDERLTLLEQQQQENKI